MSMDAFKLKDCDGDWFESRAIRISFCTTMIQRKQKMNQNQF